MTSTDKKARVRERMQNTGESYTTALRKIDEALSYTRGPVSDQTVLEDMTVLADTEEPEDGFFLTLFYSLCQTADWRRAKAEEYPGDDRNAPAAEHLGRLAYDVAHMPAGDSRARWFDEAIDSEVYVDDGPFIRAIGFSGGFPDLTHFLARLAGEYGTQAKMQRSANRYVVASEAGLIMTDEARLRRAKRLLGKRGFRVERSRQRNSVPNIDNYGGFMIVNNYNRMVAAGEQFELTIDDVEDYAADAISE